ncbi:hypothetical protein XENTR_v10010459 [Xenopus tropicalis]|nr:hypothetical protein XENTR_v10010459 [Xenopus tropicalis]
MSDLVTMAAFPFCNSMVLTAPAAGSHTPRTYKMSEVRTLSLREYEADEGEAVPCDFPPQPLALGLGGTAESHPLLDISLTPDKGGGILRRKSSERRQGQRQVGTSLGLLKGNSLDRYDDNNNILKCTVFQTFL